MNKGLMYRTVTKRVEAELTEKKSRFIGTCIPVKTEQEALSFLAEMRSKYYDATHNVYAYVIGENNIARFSDDGEPSQTAGLPVLDVIKKEGITDTCIVVTRYFGGTLLGTGGLVRAYSKTAKLALDEAVPRNFVYCSEVCLRCSYDMLGKLRYLIETNDYILSDIIYEERVRIIAHIRADRLESFKKQVTEATNGTVSVEITGETYVEE